MSNQPGTCGEIGERRDAFSDMDLDALLAGTHFASLDPCMRGDLMALDFAMDVDALVASGFAGSDIRGMALAA